MTRAPRRFRLGDQPGRCPASQDRRDLLGELPGRDAAIRRGGQSLLEALDARLDDAVQPRAGLREQVPQRGLVTGQSTHAEDLDGRGPPEGERRAPEQSQDPADHRGDRGGDAGRGQVSPGLLLAGLLLLLVLALLRLAGLLRGPAFIQPALSDQLGVDRCGQLAGELLGVLVS
jgi:hypothetical protein